MAKRRRMPVSEDTVVYHKRKRNAGAAGRGIRSVCGRYGYTVLFWLKVNCDVCLNSRK